MEVKVRGAHLVLAGAVSGPDEGVRAQVALDVGGDDLSGDAVTRHEPLICPRHVVLDAVCVLCEG